MFSKKTGKIKPIVVITHSDHQSWIQLFFIKLAIYLAGGSPILISPTDKNPPKIFDALVLYGGVDIHPTRYHKQAKLNYDYDQPRDAMELSYLGIANKKNCAVLGICRGAQLMNIYHGGNLHIDISKAYEKAMYPTNLLGYIFFRKKISISDNSLLKKIIGKDNIKINSLHRQCIDSIGHSLSATAFEDNGVIQSIEDNNKLFYLGVQFHPEFLLYRKRIRCIFNTLIQAANKMDKQPSH